MYLNISNGGLHFAGKERERGSSQGADPALDEEQKLRKRVTKGAWGIAKDKFNIHASMEKVQTYEEAFAEIQVTNFWSFFFVLL